MLDSLSISSALLIDEVTWADYLNYCMKLMLYDSVYNGGPAPKYITCALVSLVPLNNSLLNPTACSKKYSICFSVAMLSS